MYTLKFLPAARADVRRLDAAIRKRVRTGLNRLCATCDTRPHHALKGPYRGKFRLRVAEVYRVIYTFNKSNQEITVHRIQHRSRAYH